MDSSPVSSSESPDDGYWSRHRLVLLLVSTVSVSLVLTIVGVVLYAASGAAQLDLSRPGYQSVSSQVDRETKIDEYAAFGTVNEQSINEFIELYEAQSKKATSVDAFNGDPLNPEVLGTDNAAE